MACQGELTCRILHLLSPGLPESPWPWTDLSWCIVKEQLGLEHARSAALERSRKWNGYAHEELRASSWFQCALRYSPHRLQDDTMRRKTCLWSARRGN